MNFEEYTQEPDPEREAVREFTDGSEPVAESLREIREGIDSIDEEIIRLLGQRASLVRDAARFKKTLGEVPVLGRQDAQFERIHNLAESQQSPLRGFPELVESTYRSLIPGFVELQKLAIEQTRLIDGSGDPHK